MLDPVQATQATEPVALAGDTYPVRQLSLKEWAALHGWLKSTTPNPLRLAAAAVAELAGMGAPLDDAGRDALYSHAQAEARAWPPPIGSAAWLRAVNGTPDGAARFVQMALAGGGTELDLVVAQQLVDRASGAELNELLRVAYWGGPLKAPKVPTATISTTS
jgi:hypothetical protein